MYPLTKNWAKPLLKVAGKPVIDYLIDQLVEFPELDAIHLVSNARFYDDFVAWREGWQPPLKQRGIQIHLYNDGTTGNHNRLGAVGDLGLLLNAIEMPDGALVAAGDNILRFPLLPIWQRFLATRANHVIALAQTDLAKLRRTGVLELADDDRVVRLHEKPPHPPSTWSCPAFYFLWATALRRVNQFLKQPDPPDAPGHFIAELVHQEPVYAFKTNLTRFDIGSMDSYREADRVLRQEPVILLNGKLKTTPRENRPSPPSPLSQ